MVDIRYSPQSEYFLLDNYFTYTQLKKNHNYLLVFQLIITNYN